VFIDAGVDTTVLETLVSVVIDETFTGSPESEIAYSVSTVVFASTFANISLAYSLIVPFSTQSNRLINLS